MSDVDIENVCRLCCEKKGRLRSLFEHQASKHLLPLQQLIFDVTRLDVEPGDGMPQKICRACSSTLVKMHETIEVYRANDLKLRAQLRIAIVPQVEIKEEEVDVELLEKTCQQDMIVNNICIKEEPEEEYLDYEQLDESKVEVNPPKEDGSETETADELADELAEGDDEWTPIKEQKGLDTTSKKSTGSKKPSGSKKRKKEPEDDWFSKPVPKRIRWRDPDRPRFSDFKCYVCMSESHGSVEGVLAHLNSNHLDLLPYTCQQCVKETVVIKTVMALNHHKRQHMNPEQCPYCDRRYTSKNNVAQHVLMYHTGDNDPNPSPCEQCGKVYPTKLALKNHMRLHTSGAACEVCGKVFKERHKLKRHIQTRHEKLRAYECHICKKKLSSMSSVQIHINTYHSSQIFTCSHCPKTFTSKLTHQAHERKHVENPNYVATKDWREYYTVLEGEEGKVSKLKKCKLCDMVTRNMAPHLSKIHFPTEHRCEICGQTFKSKQTFDIHVQEHETGKAYSCPICGREFSERKNLITHLRTKKHRDHPLARTMLSTIKTRPNPTNEEGGNSEEDDVTHNQEEIQIDY